MFGWGRVNFHRNWGGQRGQLIQLAKGILDTTRCNAQYMTGGAGHRRELLLGSMLGISFPGGEQLHRVSLLLLFLLSFAVILNCFYPSP